MDDYISRRDLLARYDAEHNGAPGRARELIEQAPAADVAPVVHGAWVYDPNANDWGIGGYICSECKSKNNNLPITRMKLVKMFSGSEYCPNCGAKMDKEDNT